MNQSVSPTRS